MSSVTQRIKGVKQPRGGYVKVKEMETTTFEDDNMLSLEENVNSGLIGLSVDYLTRFMLTKDVNDAFFISFLGASNIGKLRVAKSLAKKIKGLDDKSIINAVKLVGFDVCYRVGPIGYVPVKQINPDKKTINNIRIMVNRSIRFFETYGPVVKDGFTFEGGYSSIITSGDGDFLTYDTLWDFKRISKNSRYFKCRDELLSTICI